MNCFLSGVRQSPLLDGRSLSAKLKQMPEEKETEVRSGSSSSGHSRRQSKHK